MHEPGEIIRRISDRLPAVHLPVSDRSRLVLAVVLALLIHGIVFLVVPGPAERELQPFDAPLYVSFDPLPEPPPEPQPVPEPEPPPEPSEPSPEPSEPPQPEPLTPDLLRGEADAVASTIPERAPTATPESSRQRTPAPPQRPPQPSEPPTPAPTPTPPAPPPPGVPDPEPVPAEVPPVREAPTRTVQRGDLQSAPSAIDDRRLAADLERFYDWQEQFTAELADYQQQQDAVLSDAIDPTPRDREISDSQDFIEDQLNRILAAIRAADGNVITLRDGNGPESPAPDPDTDDRSEGDGSGIELETPGGTRRRVAGSSLDLREVSLPTGFPAEYPVRVVFRVDARGEVISARPTPPTPSVELNSRIRAAVEEWRFEPAPGSSAVEGSVTIIVDTTARR